MDNNLNSAITNVNKKVPEQLMEKIGREIRSPKMTDCNGFPFIELYWPTIPIIQSANELTRAYTSGIPCPQGITHDGTPTT